MVYGNCRRPRIARVVSTPPRPLKAQQTAGGAFDKPRADDNSHGPRGTRSATASHARSLHSSVVHPAGRPKRCHRPRRRLGGPSVAPRALHRHARLWTDHRAMWRSCPPPHVSWASKNSAFPSIGRLRHSRRHSPCSPLTQGRLIAPVPAPTGERRCNARTRVRGIRLRVAPTRIPASRSASRSSNFARRKTATGGVVRGDIADVRPDPVFDRAPRKSSRLCSTAILNVGTSTPWPTSNVKRTLVGREAGSRDRARRLTTSPIVTPKPSLCEASERGR